MANARSTVDVSEECMQKFSELKTKKVHRFVIFKVDEKMKVTVEKVGERQLSYEEFAENLPANECRFAVYDFEFVTEENCQKSKIVFIAWAPETSKIRNKMIYTTTKENFKAVLGGFQIELQATDPTEMGIDVIRGRAN